MPSFDVVSDVDMHEVRNAIDQANREIATRFDFKSSDARVEQTDNRLTVYADDEYKVGQAVDILRTKLAKRKVDLDSLQAGHVRATGGGKAKQEITVRSGIDQELSKRIVKLVKNSKLKVQATIQGTQIRVAGKKRDDLQVVITMLKGENFDLPLQFVNFRD